MPNTDQLRLLACQIDIPTMTTVAERDEHLNVSVEKVRDAIATQGDVDLVVLPELSSIDYSRETFSRLDVFGENLDGPSFLAWSALARELSITIVYGFPRVGEGCHHISMGVVGPDGILIGHYDKLHLAQYGASMEKEYYTRGDHLCVFEVNGFRVSPIICYDIRIPELSRSLVLNHGVDLILHCGAYYRDESFATWHQFAITRAIENQVFFSSLNRAGENYGNSLFCYPWMDENSAPIDFSAHNEAFVRVIVDHGVLVNARRDYTFLNDRLSDYNVTIIP
ncbi:carbon-nitrogen hydrolase family protein [Roseovarius sp. EL26]|uniref:carbon-nitrogen hydrolase family protein n=1 Tax=Roseovarius sp. EL26 TaxID=2126672 RepID=UPI000EA03F37|nr:carbon-nitrogen hydrolase family protein [Roseovarius sp. EL26]